MKFSDTRPPVNDGSQYLHLTAGQIIAEMFKSFTPEPNWTLADKDERKLSARYTRARLAVVMRPTDWDAWTDDEKRLYRNALKRERRAAR